MLQPHAWRIFWRERQKLISNMLTIKSLQLSCSGRKLEYDEQMHYNCCMIVYTHIRSLANAQCKTLDPGAARLLSICSYQLEQHVTDLLTFVQQLFNLAHSVCVLALFLLK